jgi:CRP-like cAMP-binding protein
LAGSRRVDEANLFLRRLCAPDLDFLRPKLRRLQLSAREVLAEAETEVSAAFLPIDCILSVITVMDDGRLVESRTIGRESAFGLLHALGSRFSYERVEAQIAGEAWTLPLSVLSELGARSPAAMRTMVEFGQATIVQSAIAVACNSFHNVEQRMARWLLETQDRLVSNVLPLTQEHLAIMLAVQRTTVTATALRLQQRGLIRYTRGRITVLDRPGLMDLSCECFEQIEDGVARLVGGQRMTS